MKNCNRYPLSDQALSSDHRAPRFGVLAAAPLFAAVMLWALAPHARAAEPAPAAPAAAYVLAYRDVPDLVSAEGVVEAVRQSTLAAQIPGQIVELRVKVGDSVKAGQVLARIDPRAAEQVVSGSQSQLAEAQAGLTNALRSYERNKQLFAQKFISKAGLDQAELDYKAAQARVGAVQANAGQASMPGHSPPSPRPMLAWSQPRRSKSVTWRRLGARSSPYSTPPACASLPRCRSPVCAT